ncbi:MAG: thioredoxin [Thermoplasmatota archaeon]
MVDEADPELEALRKKKMLALKTMLEKESERKTWPSEPVHVTDLNFQETVSRYPLVLVDFWASWCMPCKMIAPVLDQLSEEFRGKAVIAKLDVDRNKRTADTFKVSGIPTLIMFRDGRPVERITGALPRQALKGIIEKHLQ